MPPTTNTSTRARNSACCTTTGWRTSPTTGLSGSPIPSGPGPAHPRPRERCSAMPGASGWPSGSPSRCRGPCTRAGEDGAFGDGAARVKVDEEGGMTRFFEYSFPSAADAWRECAVVVGRATLTVAASGCPPWSGPPGLASSIDSKVQAVSAVGTHARFIASEAAHAAQAVFDLLAAPDRSPWCGACRPRLAPAYRQSTEHLMGWLGRGRLSDRGGAKLRHGGRSLPTLPAAQEQLVQRCQGLHHESWSPVVALAGILGGFHVA